MNSQLNKSDTIRSAFDQIFNERTSEEQLASEARLLSFRFLDIIERKCQNTGMSRKDLAKKVGTSPSYITQLFRGNKLINMLTLAKFKSVLNIEFEIKEKIPYEEQVKKHPYPSDGKGVWVYRPFKTPDYNNPDKVPTPSQKEELIA
ncbi:MAG: helix-turn-helix domain-containing protein [Marinilabilia sp.]